MEASRAKRADRTALSANIGACRCRRPISSVRRGATSPWPCPLQYAGGCRLPTFPSEPRRIRLDVRPVDAFDDATYDQKRSVWTLGANIQAPQLAFVMFPRQKPESQSTCSAQRSSQWPHLLHRDREPSALVQSVAY
jgi:hypothetical protein